MSDRWTYFDLASEIFEEALNATYAVEQAKLLDEVLRLHRLAMEGEKGQSGGTERRGPLLRARRASS